MARCPTSVLALRALLAAGLALAVHTSAAQGSRVPLPELPRAQGKQCVEPVEIMRRDHMEFLLHQRDDTVHQGIRTRRHSLVQCVSCHSVRDDSGALTPVNAPGQFCAVCHEYASVRIDCFECHATTPDSGGTASPAAPGLGPRAERLRQRVRLQAPRE